MDKANNVKIKQKPPYLLGLLCLIPLIGAFVGIGLIINGIIKYKDKWMIIIGAFGIIFTITIYSSLSYLMKNGDSSKKGFAKISQMQLNNLLKNIEFYKLENGQYPESLEQLKEKDIFAPIDDPIQNVQSRKNTIFNYYRIGDNYNLFSSGQDGIPNTEDDLYPIVSIQDSTKIGLRSQNK